VIIEYAVRRGVLLPTFVSAHTSPPDTAVVMNKRKHVCAFEDVPQLRLKLVSTAEPGEPAWVHTVCVLLWRVHKLAVGFCLCMLLRETNASDVQKHCFACAWLTQRNFASDTATAAVCPYSSSQQLIR
jgi:hypothetical protein